MRSQHPRQSFNKTAARDPPHSLNWSHCTSGTEGIGVPEGAEGPLGGTEGKSRGAGKHLSSSRRHLQQAPRSACPPAPRRSGRAPAGIDPVPTLRAREQSHGGAELEVIRRAEDGVQGPSLDLEHRLCREGQPRPKDGMGEIGARLSPRADAVELSGRGTSEAAKLRERNRDPTFSTFPRPLVRSPTRLFRFASREGKHQVR
jgi:hypothetical protein